MGKIKYIKQVSNEDGWTDWIRPEMKEYRLACCDCGSVHRIDFRIRRGGVEYRAMKDYRATGQKRRYGHYENI